MDPLGRPNFRMNKATFDTLCETLRLDLQKQHTQYRDPVSVETRVACGIWRLATGETFWACGLQFGLGTATAWIISREFEEALCNRADDYIHFPTTDEETDEVMQQFEEEYKFPQIVGATDGCRIENKAPIQNPEDYNTRKQFYGVTLQGIADCNLLFRHISVGFPGCIHDARVLEISGINNLANNKHILNSPARTIRDVELRPMLAGDSAYPLSSWLLKPFSRRRNLLRHERKFNKKFSAMRSVIERAFGMLKFRWKMEEVDQQLKSVPRTVKAACVLYNFCIMEGDNYGDDQQDRGSSLIRWDSMVTITQMEKPQGNLLWLNLFPGELYRRVKLVQAWLFYWRLRWLGKVDHGQKTFPSLLYFKI